ncbi:hypothetical protein [Desulfovibrio sp. DV]
MALAKASKAALGRRRR